MKYVRIPPNMGRCVFSQLCQFSLMLVPCIRSKCCVVAHSTARITGLLMSSIAFKTAGVAIPAACSPHSKMSQWQGNLEILPNHSGFSPEAAHCAWLTGGLHNCGLGWLTGAAAAKGRPCAVEVGGWAAQRLKWSHPLLQLPSALEWRSATKPSMRNSRYFCSST